MDRLVVYNYTHRGRQQRNFNNEKISKRLINSYYFGIIVIYPLRTIQALRYLPRSKYANDRERIIRYFICQQYLNFTEIMTCEGLGKVKRFKKKKHYWRPNVLSPFHSDISPFGTNVK